MTTNYLADALRAKVQYNSIYDTIDQLSRDNAEGSELLMMVMQRHLNEMKDVLRGALEPVKPSLVAFNTPS
jgi:hypothetical protein